MTITIDDYLTERVTEFCPVNIEIAQVNMIIDGIGFDFYDLQDNYANALKSITQISDLILEQFPFISSVITPYDKEDGETQMFALDFYQE